MDAPRGEHERLPGKLVSVPADRKRGEIIRHAWVRYHAREITLRDLLRVLAQHRR